MDPEGAPREEALVIGILAVQGAFALHGVALRELGATPVEVRTADQLAEVDALVLPGGESTTISMMLEANDLFDPLAERLAAGLPAFGTCAGMILLARQVLDGRSDQRCFGAIDVDVRRNAFGRQVDSFEAELPIEGMDGGAFPAIFIRAPVIERAGPGVEVLATVDDIPVLCRQGRVLVASFHPELSEDLRLHRCFLDRVSSDAVPSAADDQKDQG